MKKLAAISSLVLLFSCAKTNKEIVTSHMWKPGGGYPVAGNWLDFSLGTVSFSNDTVYNDANPVAVVDSITTYYGEYRLHLKSLSGNNSGTYVEKGEN